MALAKRAGSGLRDGATVTLAVRPQHLEWSHEP